MTHEQKGLEKKKKKGSTKTKSKSLMKQQMKEKWGKVTKSKTEKQKDTTEDSSYDKQMGLAESEMIVKDEIVKMWKTDEVKPRRNKSSSTRKIPVTEPLNIKSNVNGEMLEENEQIDVQNSME